MSEVCGTVRGYWRGCKCLDCKKAASEYQKSRNKARAANAVTGDEAWHGSLNGHQNYGCRCEPCKGAYLLWKRKYNADNRDRLNKQARERYAEDPARVNANSKRWQQKNRDRLREYERQRYRDSPDQINAKNRAYSLRKRGADCVPFTAEQLRLRWEYYGNRCYICCSAAEASDHVKPLAKGGAHMLANLRPICTPCNSRKQDKWPFVIQEQHA